MSEATPLQAVLARLKGVKKSGGGHVARCPAHDDRNPSLSVTEGRDGRVLLNCHHGCSADQVVHAIGLELKDLFAGETVKSDRSESGSRRIVRAFTYTDEDGRPLYQAVRWEPKSFTQQQTDGQGGWLPHMRGMDRRVPYQLPSVIQAVQDGKQVYVVEGEKDADRLKDLGFHATCNVGGAGKWATPKELGDQLSRYFEGAQVVVVPDNDQAGRRHANDVATRLTVAGAEVRILKLPGLPEGGDVSDWLEVGGTAERLAVLTARAPLWQPQMDEEPSGDPEPEDAAQPTQPSAGRIPPPKRMRDLLAVEAPEVSWLAKGLIPAGANILTSAAPKCYKTFACLDLAIAGASATPFLGHAVEQRFRSAIILMEGSEHWIRSRVERLCLGRGIDPMDLDPWFFYWHRPPVELSSPSDMAQIARYVQENEIDLLMIDNWSYVATGNSNDSDEVTPQLKALSSLRDARPNLSVLLVHHTKKVGGGDKRGSDRITDLTRNSTAFGAWFDVGIMLERQDGFAPVKVRTEMRDHPTPQDFTFKAEDEFAPGSDGEEEARGWLRLVRSGRPPEMVQKEDSVDRMMRLVAAFLMENQGCPKERIMVGFTGDKTKKEEAFKQLCEKGFARFQEPTRHGLPGRCWLNYTYPQRQRIGEPRNVPASARDGGSDSNVPDVPGTSLQGRQRGRDGTSLHPPASPPEGGQGRVPPHAGAREGGQGGSDAPVLNLDDARGKRRRSWQDPGDQ